MSTPTDTEPAPVDQLPPVDQPAAVPAGPVPMLAGTFAIYEDGKGGFVLVLDTPAHGVQRKHVPAKLVKLATGGGVLGKAMSGLFGAVDS